MAAAAPTRNGGAPGTHRPGMQLSPKAAAALGLSATGSHVLGLSPAAPMRSTPQDPIWQHTWHHELSRFFPRREKSREMQRKEGTARPRKSPLRARPLTAAGCPEAANFALFSQI